jgi:hypothetical protein
MAYPATLDDLLGDLPPSGDSNLFEYDHFRHHQYEDAAIEALQAKVGIDGSNDPNSIDYLLKNPASIDPGHKHTYLWAKDGNPQQALFVNNYGWIGFGTTAPDAKYHFFETNQTYDNVYQGIRLGQKAMGMFMALGIIDNPSSGNRRGFINVMHDWGISYDLILQTAGGTVGIGYPSTGARLYVADAVNTWQTILSVVLKNTTNNAGYGPKIDFRGGTTETIFGQIGAQIKTSGNLNNTEFFIMNRWNGNLVEGIRIGQNGWVGIGGVAPEAMLHLYNGEILLNNNYSLKGKDSSGNIRSMIKMNTSNIVEIGDGSATQTKLVGPSTNNLIGIDNFPTYTDTSNITYDYPLQVGQKARITFSNVTSKNLRIWIGSGRVYRLIIVLSNNYGSSGATSGGIMLNPNNTTYSNAFQYTEIYRTSSGLGSGYQAVYSAFRIGWAFSFVDCIIQTDTTNKHIVGHYSMYGLSDRQPGLTIFSCGWNDTTTAWNYLGTIVFPQASSGKIIVERIE